MRKVSNIIWVLIAFILAFQQSAAQNLENLPNLKELRGKALEEEIAPMQNKKGMWGYANAEGKFIIRPLFHDALPFEGSVARIKFNGKWGTISDKAQYIVIPVIFDNIDPYSADSLAVVVRNNKHGIINAKGHILQSIVYDGIEYMDYGYRSLKDGKYGTISKDGNTIFENQFDEMSILDRNCGVELICKDGKWGLLKEGRDILTLQWDSPLLPLQKGVEGIPDLYIASQNGKYGVVNVYGKFVTPCVYDEIAKSVNGMYYITRHGDRYGALSLKMHELIPPVLETRPYLDDDIFRLYLDSGFMAVNHKGAIPFRDCADLFQTFRPEDYVATDMLPEWSKNAIIEDNLTSRVDEIDKARALKDAFEQSGYSYSKSVLHGNDRSRYGILPNGSFRKESGTVSDYEGGYHNVNYAAYGDDGENIYLVTDPSAGEVYLNGKGELFSLRKSVSKLNIKKFSSFYPVGYSHLSDTRIFVHFAFIRPSAEVSEDLVETNEFLLPVEPFELNVHKGQPVPASETHAAFIFDTDSLEVVGYVGLPGAAGCRVLPSVFGGFYIVPSPGTSGQVVRLDRNGNHDWAYVPAYGEKIYDIEETESYVYLCGCSGTPDSPSPVVIQLSKEGAIVGKHVVRISDSWFTEIKCQDHLIYAKTASLESKGTSGDYYPFFLLDDMWDDFGVRLCCAWEDWGGKALGGCGLISHDGRWLSTLMLSPEDTHYAFGWEFGAFSSDYLIVRHHDKAGLIDRSGKMVIETEYDDLDYMSDPSFIKVYDNDKYGVIDVSGKVIVPVEYDYVGNMSEGFIIVRKRGLYGCYDNKGRMTVPMEYEEIREFVGGMARIKVKDRFGFIDTTGEIVVAPFSDEVENFAEDCALVTIKDKLGFVTIDGDWIVVPMYEDGSSFSGGLAYLSHKGKYGYIDKSGDFVIPMQYTKATDFHPVYKVAAVAVGNSWGIIDSTGEIKVPLKYDSVQIADDGYICVCKDGKYGVLSLEGREIIGTVLDKIEFSNGNIFRYGAAGGRIGEQRIRVDLQGNIVHGIWVSE